MRLVIIQLVTLVMLSACNTVQGVGQDVQSAGDVIEDSATSVQQAVTN